MSTIVLTRNQIDFSLINVLLTVLFKTNCYVLKSSVVQRELKISKLHVIKTRFSVVIGNENLQVINVTYNQPAICYESGIIIGRQKKNDIISKLFPTFLKF